MCREREDPDQTEEKPGERGLGERGLICRQGSDQRLETEMSKLHRSSCSRVPLFPLQRSWFHPFLFQILWLKFTWTPFGVFLSPFFYILAPLFCCSLLSSQFEFPSLFDLRCSQLQFPPPSYPWFNFLFPFALPYRDRGSERKED